MRLVPLLLLLHVLLLLLLDTVTSSHNEARWARWARLSTTHAIAGHHSWLLLHAHHARLLHARLLVHAHHTRLLISSCSLSHDIFLLLLVLLLMLLRLLLLFHLHIVTGSSLALVVYNLKVILATLDVLGANQVVNI